MPDVRTICAAVLLSVCAPSILRAEPIPPEMAGVWATEDAVIRGPLLFEGQAFYLGRDGVAAWVGGPPPIGFPMQCSYEPQMSAVACSYADHMGEPKSGRIPYDAISGAFVHEDQPLVRRYDDFDAATRKAILGPNY